MRGVHVVASISFFVANYLAECPMGTGYWLQVQRANTWLLRVKGPDKQIQMLLRKSSSIRRYDRDWIPVIPVSFILTFHYFLV